MADDVKSKFRDFIAKDPKIKRLLAKEKPDYLDADEYGIRIGEILGDIIDKDTLEEFQELMIDDHTVIADYTKGVQNSLNHEAGINMQALSLPVNRDRLDGLVKFARELEEISSELKESIINFNQDIVATSIERNAEFQSEAGLKPKIVRRFFGGCDWCREVAGSYRYPDVPHDVYRRHKRCRCTVNYYPGDGRRQDVHTKKWKDQHGDEIQERIRKSEEPTGEISDVRQMLLEKDIKYNPIRKYNGDRSEEEIIKSIAGGDLTSGSCASVGLCYIGNKGGYVVKDFRGGESMDFFASKDNKYKLLDIDGVKGKIIDDTNDIRAVKRLAKEYMQTGKEYYLSTGRHAAIVRKVANTRNPMKGLEYLELQSPETKGYVKNGFHRIKSDLEFKNRFGAKTSHSMKYIGKYEVHNMAIDVDSLKDNAEFHKILGFLNTDTGKQMKGVDGYVR